MQNESYVATPKPAVKKRGGKGLSIAALIIAIVSMILGGVSFWFVFWFAYGRMNSAVITLSFLSLFLAVTAIGAIIMAIIAKVKGAHTAMLVVTILTACLTFPSVLLNGYILIYYIGMTY